VHQILLGVPVVLSVHGTMGFGSSNAFLNVLMEPAVRTMRYETIRDALRDILRYLRAG
jgi:hypothetical protein